MFPVRFRAALLLPGLLLAPTALMRAQLVSVEDVAVPTGSSYVIGLTMQSPGNVLLNTVAELYYRPSVPTATFTKTFVTSDFMEGLDTTSTTAVNPLNDRVVTSSITMFVPAVTSNGIHSPFPVQVLFPTGTVDVGTLAFDSSGALYYFDGSSHGISKLDFQNFNATPLFTFGTSGAGALTSRSYGLAAVSNVVYALDLPGNRIARYDASNGNYLGAFAVTGAEADSALAVSANGRLYLTTGSGGGNIYDAVTGASLGTFAAGASHPDVDGGHDGLVINDATGNFYTFDAATGFHVFSDSAITAIPEPGTTAALTGLAALVLVVLRRRRAPA